MNYLTVALVTGCLAILLGTAPMGRFLDVLADLEDGLNRFRDSLHGLGLRPVRLVSLNRERRLGGQIWFAVAGVILILSALIAYLAS